MNRITTLLLILILIASSVVIFLPVKAQSKTITVPDDYPTIAAAIGNATSGDTIFIKAGNYSGPMYQTLKINKSLSIIGEGADFTKINLTPSFQHQEYDTMQQNELLPTNPYGERVHINTTTWDTSLIIDANDVKISNISITSLGDAFISGDRDQIIKSNIAVPQVSLNVSHSIFNGDSFNSQLVVNGSYSTVSENNLTFLSVNGSYLNVSDNTVSEGMHLKGEYCQVSENNGGGLTIEGSNIEISRNNVNYVTTDGSDCYVHENYAELNINGNENIIAGNIVDHKKPYGIAVGGSNNSIYANEITHSGIGLAASGKSNIIYANNIANNTWGIDIGYDAATVYQNNFIANRYQVSTINKMNQPFFYDNGSLGNYWSDYGGPDANKNGIGDKPYVIGDNRSDRYPLTIPFDTNSVNITVPDWVTAYSAILSPTPSPQPQTPQPNAVGNSEFFSTTLVIGSVLSVVVVGLGLLVYFKKRKRQNLNNR